MHPGGTGILYILLSLVVAKTIAARSSKVHALLVTRATHLAWQGQGRAIECGTGSKPKIFRTSNKLSVDLEEPTESVGEQEERVPARLVKQRRICGPRRSIYDKVWAEGGAVPLGTTDTRSP